MDMELRYADVSEMYRTLERHSVAIEEKELALAHSLAEKWRDLYVFARTKDLRLAIQKGRTAKGLTQKQLATQLNMQPAVINEYESGKAVPNNAVIAKIEKALGCKLPRAPKK